MFLSHSVSCYSEATDGSREEGGIIMGFDGCAEVSASGGCGEMNLAVEDWPDPDEG